MQVLESLKSCNDKPESGTCLLQYVSLFKGKRHICFTHQVHGSPLKRLAKKMLAKCTSMAPTACFEVSKNLQWQAKKQALRQLLLLGWKPSCLYLELFKICPWLDYITYQIRTGLLSDRGSLNLFTINKE